MCAALFNLLRRLLYVFILLLAVIILNFALIHLAPGDPAQVIAGEMGGATQEILNQIRTAYGLDKPFYQQLYIYLSKILQGDFGFSLYFNRPVLELITMRIPATILLVMSSLTFAVSTGTFLGSSLPENLRGF